MSLFTLPLLAFFIILLNEGRYLTGYRAKRLPRFGPLVVLLLVPLVIVDHEVTDFWLHLTWLLLLSVGALASFIDWERHLLPDRLTMPALAVSISSIALTHGLHSEFIGGLFGGFGWFFAFALLALINPDGLGWGDVKFAALLGFACGAIELKLVPVAILLASVTGGAYAVMKIVRGNRRTQIPFGPFMFLGAIASLIGR